MNHPMDNLPNSNFQSVYFVGLTSSRSSILYIHLSHLNTGSRIYAHSKAMIMIDGQDHFEIDSLIRHDLIGLEDSLLMSKFSC